MLKITKEIIDDLLKQKLIVIKQSKNYPDLSVIKYHRRVFYDNLWEKNELLKECRGLVIDKDHNVVVHPFTKVYNRNETPDADIPGDETVLCVRKINGFMGAVTYHDSYGWIYSTTGSLDSDFIQYIKDCVGPFESQLKKTHGVTYIFEIVHPNDPHIVTEETGAYLIGCRDTDGSMVSEKHLDLIAHKITGVMRPMSFITHMKNVNGDLKSCQHEGFMVHQLDADLNQTGKVIKMKSPFYLIRKMIARKQDLNAALVNAKKVKENLEEELFCIVDAVDKNKELVQNMNEQERLQFMTDVLNERFSQ